MEKSSDFNLKIWWYVKSNFQMFSSLSRFLTKVTQAAVVFLLSNNDITTIKAIRIFHVNKTSICRAPSNTYLTNNMRCLKYKSQPVTSCYLSEKQKSSLAFEEKEIQMRVSKGQVDCTVSTKSPTTIRMPFRDLSN